MIIKLAREHRVNVGDYEHIIVSGSIEHDTLLSAEVASKLSADEAKKILAEAQEFVRDQLDRLLHDELEAAEAAVPEDRETHLMYYKK